MKRAQVTATRALVTLVLLAVVFRLVGMAWLPLMDTTEARYAEIGRKMFELGDWITPWHDDGVPFWGKPPLSFWMTALSFRTLGVNEFAARLPHFLAMLAVVWTVWALARRRTPGEGLTAVALLAGAALSFISAGAVMTDGALVVGTTLAMRGFWLGMSDAQATAGRERWLVFVGLAVGLLAKGPLALVLFGVPVTAWTVVTKQYSLVWQRFPWLLGICLALLIAAPWYVAAEVKTPGFLQYFLAGEHWHRFVTPGWKGDLYGNAHRFPPGTIWVFALAATMPWSILLPVAAWSWRSAPATGVAAADDRSWRLYLLCWSLAPLLFFTAARNIIWTYALPALPALSLYTAHWLARRVTAERAQWLLVGGLTVSLVASVVLVLNLATSGSIDRRSAKDLVARWDAAKTEDEPLVFVHKRLFSAAFYSAGRAQLAATNQAAVQRLAGRRGFVATANEDGLPDLGAQLVGRFGDYQLFEIPPARAGGGS